MSQKISADSVAFYFEAADQEKIYVQAWPLSQKTLKGVIQIAHGLGETADYYSEFSEAANKAGFAVYLLEARGHGRTAGDINLPQYAQKAGDIGDDGFIKLRDDQHELTKIIKAEYPNIPIFLLGHSMGATIARLYSFVYGNEINGLILTGASSASTGTDELLKLVEKEIAENGLKAPCKATFAAMFPKLNQQFEPTTTELDWITSDKEMIAASLGLPYTYILFNNQFYKSMFLALKEASKATNLDTIPKTLPIFLLSGDKDVVTDNGRHTLSQVKTYRELGIQEVEYKLYEDKRHSILREVNRTEVTLDILNWIEGHLQR